jgi:hypothetical protein
MACTTTLFKSHMELLEKMQNSPSPKLNDGLTSKAKHEVFEGVLSALAKKFYKPELLENGWHEPTLQSDLRNGDCATASTHPAGPSSRGLRASSEPGSEPPPRTRHPLRQLPVQYKSGRPRFVAGAQLLGRTKLANQLPDLTPNDAYFVRWHYAGLPTSIDLRTFRLSVAGAVTRPLQLSESK